MACQPDSEACHANACMTMPVKIQPPPCIAVLRLTALWAAHMHKHYRARSAIVTDSPYLRSTSSACLMISNQHGKRHRAQGLRTWQWQLGLLGMHQQMAHHCHPCRLLRRHQHTLQACLSTKRHRWPAAQQCCCHHPAF